MKRWITFALILCLVLALCAPVGAANNAMLSPQKLTVDGKSINCEKYNINGENYFKLRDLAYLLNGTGSQFAVGYDAAANAVRVYTGTAYTPDGSELVIGADKSSTAQPSAQSVYIDNDDYNHGELTVYNIGGNNYFRLRDLGDALGFGVDYDERTNTVVVDSYPTEPSPELQKVLADADKLREEIINDVTEVEITGTTYYVSNDGNDRSNGRTPETAWATLEKVSSANLKRGDGVLFRRGDTFRGKLICADGVTYSAYGTGPMPLITASPENGADPDYWTLYGETPDGGKVWVYHIDMPDCGSIVFNDGEYCNGYIGLYKGKVCGGKATPRWDGSKHVDAAGAAFDPRKGLTADLAFFTPADSKLGNKPTYTDMLAGQHFAMTLSNDEAYFGTVGKLYLRCDAGNPGEVFDSIEFGATPVNVGVIDFQGRNAVLNNLRISYSGECGVICVNGEGPETLRVIQNCEISFHGGHIAAYDADGTAVERNGDGLALTTSCLVTHCYIHDTYDCNFTAETDAERKNIEISGITLSGNLFERSGDCGIQFVYFGGDMGKDNVIFRDIRVENNYILYMGDGWAGNHRGGQASCVKIGDYSPPMRSENLVVRNNFIYAPKSRSQIYGGNEGYDPPAFENNTLFVTRNSVPHRNGGVVLWAFPGGSPWANDAVEEWGWYGIDDCEPFLNGYLGSGNTVYYDR